LRSAACAPMQLFRTIQLAPQKIISKSETKPLKNSNKTFKKPTEINYGNTHNEYSQGPSS
jgi:hypothetical protein